MSGPHKMFCHPDYPGRHVKALAVDVTRPRADTIALRFVLSGDVSRIRLPVVEPAQRVDGLWESTCFEMFASLEDGYAEFNFAPNTSWAAYRFESYRKGMCMLAEMQAPAIQQHAETSWYEFVVRLPIANIVDELDGRLSLSAVIEETDGARSYWAAAHPDGKPDFHHPDCFVLQLPAAG